MNLDQRPVCLCKGSCLTFRFASNQRRTPSYEEWSKPTFCWCMSCQKILQFSCLLLFQAMLQVWGLNPQPLAHRQTCSSDIPQKEWNFVFWKCTQDFLFLCSKDKFLFRAHGPPRKKSRALLYRQNLRSVGLEYCTDKHVSLERINLTL
jgi:hypothetical protein